MVVIDASAVTSLVIESQSTPASKTFFAREDDFVAPFVFPAEVRNVLIKLRRRGYLSRDGLVEALDLIDSLVHVPSPRASKSALANIVALAEADQLSFYDAAYLRLAEQDRLALATRDKALIDASMRRGVAIHDLRAEQPE